MNHRFIMASTFLTALATLALANEYKVTGTTSSVSVTVPAATALVLSNSTGQTTGSTKTSAVGVSGGDGGNWLMASAAAKVQAVGIANIAVIPVFKPTQKNGTSLSGSINGYYEDVNRFVVPYVADGGIRALRIPLRRQNIWQNGVIQDSISLNGYKTNQWLALKPIIDYAILKDVSVVIDDHSYSAYGNPDVLAFWLALGKKLKDTYGDNDLIHLELQNETSSGGWETGYGANLKKVVQSIRASGINYPLVVGWGNWNAVGSYSKALTELDTVGGPQSLDPLGKTEFSVHHYPTTTGNDMAASGKSAPEIYGSTVNAQFPAMFDEFKRRGLHIWVTEVGMGGGAHAWLNNGSGVPAFNGQAWFEAFNTLVKQYPDNVSGVLAWGGGSGWPDTYVFKQEYAKDNWVATESTDYWKTITKFWKQNR